MTNSLTKTLRTLTLAIVATVGIQSALHAVPITGRVDMSSVMTLDNSQLDLATSIVVNNTPGSFEATVAIADQAYAGTVGTGVEWKAFSWAPLSPLPINSLWSFTAGARTYSFDLLTLSLVAPPTSTHVSLVGSGLLKISNGGPGDTVYDDTLGQFAVNITNFGGGSTNAQFVFHSSNGTPDGGTTALLIGLGLLGLSAVAHRRRKAA